MSVLHHLRQHTKLGKGRESTIKRHKQVLATECALLSLAFERSGDQTTGCAGVPLCFSESNFSVLRYQCNCSGKRAGMAQPCRLRANNRHRIKGRCGSSDTTVRLRLHGTGPEPFRTELDRLLFTRDHSGTGPERIQMDPKLEM